MCRFVWYRRRCLIIVEVLRLFWSWFGSFIWSNHSDQMIKMEKQKVFILVMLRFVERFGVKVHVIIILLSMYSKNYWSKRSVSEKGPKVIRTMYIIWYSSMFFRFAIRWRMGVLPLFFLCWGNLNMTTLQEHRTNLTFGRASKVLTTCTRMENLQCRLALGNIKYNCAVLFLGQKYFLCVL